ncbi:unnamed protein product [Miscanthus lutarioriparius]|uniref:Uncharacterized protein n=1 Tax=Miscanthus lutarioriparius TaxID=422564 RepID=A0A811SQ27_9POAL|nr:unnamed protein product [Miscanthus lutarioriparius]
MGLSPNISISSDSAVARARRGLYSRCVREVTKDHRAAERGASAAAPAAVVACTDGQGEERETEWRRRIGRRSRGDGGGLGGAPEVCAVLSVTWASTWAPSPSAAQTPSIWIRCFRMTERLSTIVSVLSSFIPVKIVVRKNNVNVKDGWDTFMFKQSHNWDVLSLPEEVKKKLSTKTGTSGSGMAWVSLDLGKEN